MKTLTYYYFAYGSNMNFAQMNDRCPGARFAGRGILTDHRFHIYSRGFASVAFRKGSMVWGGIWEITHAHLMTLDRYEGIPSNYYRREVIPVLLADKAEDTVDCEIYFGSDTEDGIPGADYMGAVLQGARDCGLPEAYVETVLKPWMP